MQRGSAPVWLLVMAVLACWLNGARSTTTTTTTIPASTVNFDNDDDYSDSSSTPSDTLLVTEDDWLTVVNIKGDRSNHLGSGCVADFKLSNANINMLRGGTGVRGIKKGVC